MGIPDRKTAHRMLKEAVSMNPGPWEGHSLYTAKACYLIASQCRDMDTERAYVSGLLHDIGRREGKYFMRHTIDGYRYLVGSGYEEVAGICLTHSFADRNTDAIFGRWDCPKEDVEFVRRYIEETCYNDYDTLVQLCDNLALDNGFCILEKRMIDVQMRYGVNRYTVAKWKATFRLLEYYRKKTGTCVYSLLPGIAETTFEMDFKQFKPKNT